MWKQVNPFIISIVYKLFPHIVFQCTIYHNRSTTRCLHYGICLIMIYVVFFQKFLHVRVVKFFSHIGLQIFRTSSIISNYLCDRYSHLISIFDFQWYGPCMFTQYIDNGENVVIMFVESCKGASRPNQPTTGHRIRKLRGKFFLAEYAVFSLFETFLLRHVMLCYDYCYIMRKIS